jgi:hypothetical protein
MPTNIKGLLKYSIKYDHQVGKVVQITKDMFTSLEIATSILTGEITSFTSSISTSDKPSSIHESTQSPVGGTTMEASTQTMITTPDTSVSQTKSGDADRKGHIMGFKCMVQSVHEKLHHADVHKVYSEIKNKGISKRRLLRSICSVIRSCSCDVSSQLQQQKIPPNIEASSKLPAKPTSRHVEKDKPLVYFHRPRQKKIPSKTHASSKGLAKCYSGRVDNSKSTAFKRQCNSTGFYERIHSRNTSWVCLPKPKVCPACHHLVCVPFGIVKIESFLKIRTDRWESNPDLSFAGGLHGTTVLRKIPIPGHSQIQPIHPYLIHSHRSRRELLKITALRNLFAQLPIVNSTFTTISPASCNKMVFSKINTFENFHH